MKRMVLVFGLLIVFYFSFGISYKFYHIPANDVKIYYNTVRGYSYLKYIGDMSFYKKLDSYDFSEIFEYLEKVKYVNFFRYSYFWKDTFSSFRCNNLDFSYLDNKFLEYPILGVGINDKLLLFVPVSLVKNLSGSEYDGYDCKIIRYKDLYIFIKNDINFNLIFDLSCYINILKSFLKTNIKILTLQIGKLPLSSVKIDNFSKYFLWIEVEKSGKLVGLILDLWKKYNPYIQYSSTFYKDEMMMNSIRELYEPIKEYYNIMGVIPQDLGSLYPNFFDITAFNKYWYKIVYKPIFPNKYKICFEPKSEEFKNLFWFYLTNGLWCETYKVF